MNGEVFFLLEEPYLELPCTLIVSEIERTEIVSRNIRAVIRELDPGALLAAPALGALLTPMRSSRGERERLESAHLLGIEEITP